jgi:hypothetical protein
MAGQKWIEKTNLKRIQLTILAAALGLAVQANASLYVLTFSATDGSGVGAIGTLDVVGGIAIGGSLVITGGANPGMYTLLAESATPGSYLYDPSSPPHASFDGLVSPGSTPFLNQDSIYGGLVWENGSDSVGYKMFYNTPAYAGVLTSTYGVPYTPDEYGLWGWHSSVSGYGPQSFGSATLTAVPESTTMVTGAMLLLPFGASTLRILRKRRAA